MKKPKPKTLNPRYKGATPEKVGRALLKHKPKLSRPTKQRRSS